jgi:nucleoside-diphosphate-sugar epimerase
MKSPRVAVVGAAGYVGSALCEAIARQPDVVLMRVTRESYEQARGAFYDVLINAAMPSGRFWAKNNPDADYQETVQKTADLLKNWRCQKFVQISTVSARCDKDSVYGKHKAEAEKLCASDTNLIIRLSAMYSQNLSKGALIDMLNGRKVFVSGESLYPFAPLSFVADWISRNLDRMGLVEVGARNAISLQDIAKSMHWTIDFEGPAEDQSLVKPEPDFPDSRDVVAFLKKHQAVLKK